MRSTLAISLTFVLAGCAYGELKQVLRAQVAAETNCGDVSVESTPLYTPGYAPGQYRVKGCGIDRTYLCPKQDGLVSYDDTPCKPVAAAAATPAAPAAESDPALDEPLADESLEETTAE